MAFTFRQLPAPSYLGILNLTPNSFSDGDQFLDPAAGVRHARALLDAGATILDLGAEASSFFRPGVTPVAPEEQLRRLLPVLEKLVTIPRIILSIDTRSSVVAAAALERGAHIINDISAGTHDPAMLDTVAAHDAAIILMHISPNYPGNPKENDPHILRTVENYLAKRVLAATKAGIGKDKIAIDPGLGFGKTPHDNWTLALNAHKLQHVAPVVLGCSRKRFLESAPPAELVCPETWQAAIASYTCTTTPPAHPRDPASLALTEITRQNGIQLHRLHTLPPKP